MHLGQHVDLLILLVQQILQLPNLRLQGADALLERLGVASWKGTTAELVAGAAFKANIGALRAARANAIAANLLAAASVAGLGDTALGARAHLDDLHRQNSWHFGGLVDCLLSVFWSTKNNP